MWQSKIWIIINKFVFWKQKANMNWLNRFIDYYDFGFLVSTFLFQILFLYYIIIFALFLCVLRRQSHPFQCQIRCQTSRASTMTSRRILKRQPAVPLLISQLQPNRLKTIRRKMQPKGKWSSSNQSMVLLIAACLTRCILYKRNSNGGGFLGSIWNTLSMKPKNQMILPDDKNPAVGFHIVRCSVIRLNSIIFAICCIFS